MERYESLGPVGEGSYGTVLKCRHRDSGRLVAVKKFIDSDDDKTVKKIALREIKLLRQLRHDNLVNLLEVWKRRRRWYLVFEFVDRTLLDELEQNSKGLDLNTCRRYLFQILRATNFCHQQNVIHRDIKPENVLISQEGVVKLCDFGFARIIASPSEGAVYTDYVATRWYRAPELLVGDIKYGKPVDVWALGCLLIEMLTGQPLFPGDSDLDQIYHIVRCFGNLTAHHQELFYRNPIFSGVKLPECSKTVPLQQRFSTIPPNALDLAQKCLAMDPKRRAQCLDLLEHVLFTQDSFNIRFLDELDTKIQKDHRENYTLPKIPQTALQEKEKGDVKNCRSKNKKQSEEAEEKVNKEKMDKTKGKQPSKLTKSVVNTTESFMSKQPKTFGNKAICQPEQFSMKSEKPTGSELKESELLKSTNICSSDLADVTTKAINLKKKSSEHEQDISPDRRKDHAHNAKDMDYTNPDSEKTMMPIRESFKSETSNEFVRNFSNLSMKVSKLSKIAISDDKSLNSSPKPILESDTSVAPTYPLLSFNDHTASAMLDVTKSGKINLASITDIVEDECPKAQPKIPRKPQILSNSGQHGHNNTSFSPLRTVVDLSKQSFKTVSEASAAHNPSAPPRVIPHSKVPKTTCAAKTSSKEKEPTEDQHVRNYHRHLKLNPMKQTPTTPCPSSRVLDWDPESSEPYFLCSQSNMIATEERFTSTFVPDENISVGKGLTVSAKDNQDYLTSSVSISSTSNALMNTTLKAPESSANDKKNISSSLKSSNFSHHYHNPTTAQSLNDHIRSAVNPKTQRITIPPDAKKRSNKVEGNGTNASTDLTSVMSVDHKALTRSPILHEKDTTDIDEFDYSILRSCTPSPPPGPATNRLHLPPSSRTLTPSVFVSNTISPAANDHLLQGGGFHTGTNSLRSLDKPRPYGGIQALQDQQFGLNHATRSFILQASEHSFTSERSKNSLHFPDVRSSMLAELSGKDAKQNKGTTREQRTEKSPVSSSPSSEGQYGQNFNTNTPKQSK